MPQEPRATPSTGAAASKQAAPSTSQLEEPIVQYIVLRKDLWAEQGWPLGSIAAQACHASLAACWLHSNDADTKAYLAPENLEHMRKVVLEIKGEAQLRSLSATLSEAGIAHKLWVEQPEDFPTALATKPCPKSHVATHFKKLKLCKAAFQS